MVSMLDCIKRIPSLLDDILDKREDRFKALWDRYGDRIGEIDELVFIGSGTSSTASVTARYLAEEASGLRVTAAAPAEFLYSLKVRNKNALYVFISQTGTSILTGDALKLVKDSCFMNAAVSESATTPVASSSDVFINMGCGAEEYNMRTIGYSTSVLTLMLLGAWLGKKRGFLDDGKYNEYINNARLSLSSIPALIDTTMAWLDKNRRSLMRSDGIFYYGSGALYGVALEGAVKLWETPQIISAGYELEEGLHGPNFGFDHRHCVIVLNDGGIESGKAQALGKFMRNEMDNGFIIGCDTVYASDLPFETKSRGFACLEFASIVQVISYDLAVSQGRNLFEKADHTVMYSYFKPHS